MAYCILDCTAMKNGIRNLTAIIVLVGIVYYVSNYAGVIQEEIGVKGVSTQKAQGIAGEISSDVGTQLDVLAAQSMQLTLEDVVDGFARFQKIPRDIASVTEYAQEQYDHVVKSRATEK